jgi:hypothetical protein
MANEEQLSILKRGFSIWNQWRIANPNADVDISEGNLDFTDLIFVNLRKANLSGARLGVANLTGADLQGANLSYTDLQEANLSRAHLAQAIFSRSEMGYTIFGNSDLSEAIGLEDVVHHGPSTIGTDTIAKSRGKIPDVFLKGCGLSDWETEAKKLYTPGLSNEDINKILSTMFGLCTCQVLQISPLFISYSHADSNFVDKLESQLNKDGIRFWRDIHDMKSGRMETQIERAIRQNPTVLLVLSEHSLSSDWVEHEVRTARSLEKETERDVLCPVALDGSWKSSRWSKRIMEQIVEYNILDFSEWQDNSKFDGVFRKLIDGLALFYKG